MSQPDFWQQDHRIAASKAEKLDLNSKILAAETDLSDILARVGERVTTDYDTEVSKELLGDLEAANEKLVWLESQTLFNAPYDEKDAYMAFHVGAGGVDAANWNEMLMNMYLQYAKNKGWATEVVQLTANDDDGIKNATVKISGYRAYGFLKAEAGVHRLIRLSPYNAQNLRQTSFALVEVLPDLGDVDVDIKEDDLKIETFRASGNGGQSVNTTDSAVRITHVPTNITVAIQNERSQQQNRETAMKILKSKLFIRAQEEREQSERKLKAATSSAEFGQQIRTYTLHPYQQVKDHRSNFEEPRTDKILKEGNLDELIASVLMWMRESSETTGE